MVCDTIYFNILQIVISNRKMNWNYDITRTSQIYSYKILFLYSNGFLNPNSKSIFF